jgi:hypothetical protein
MNNQERDAFIMAKLNEGVSLSNVQKLLEENGVKITYMELRMLAADLEVDWQKQDPVKKPEPPAKKPAAAPPVHDLDAAEAAAGGAAPAAGAGRTTVTLSRLVRPGAVMSGDVVFASGAKGDWYLDQRGRLGLNLAKDSAKPTQEDMLDFQEELQRQLSGQA